MPKTKKSKKMVYIGMKIPQEMYDVILKHLEKDTHTSLSELVRDALREWLEKHGLLEEIEQGE